MIIGRDGGGPEVISGSLEIWPCWAIVKGGEPGNGMFPESVTCLTISVKFSSFYNTSIHYYEIHHHLVSYFVYASA